MNRTLVTVASVGALTFAVYLATGGGVQSQTDFLSDAGFSLPTHVATCGVRIDPGCADAGRQAGLQVHTYERLRFPVVVTVLPDGGRDVQLPPMQQGLVRACVQVVDWNDCALVLAASAPAVAAKWGQPLPFALSQRSCVRPNFDAGLSCLRAQSDGGTFSFGDRNVFPRAEAADTATCETVQCAIYAGDDPEVDL